MTSRVTLLRALKLAHADGNVDAVNDIVGMLKEIDAQPAPEKAPEQQTEAPEPQAVEPVAAPEPQATPAATAAPASNVDLARQQLGSRDLTQPHGDASQDKPHDKNALDVSSTRALGVPSLSALGQEKPQAPIEGSLGAIARGEPQPAREKPEVNTDPSQPVAEATTDEAKRLAASHRIGASHSKAFATEAKDYEEEQERDRAEVAKKKRQSQATADYPEILDLPHLDTRAKAAIIAGKDDTEKAKIAFKQLERLNKDVDFLRDEYGNVIAKVDGQKYYIDAPTVGLNDAGEFVSHAADFIGGTTPLSAAVIEGGKAAIGYGMDKYREAEGGDEASLANRAIEGITGASMGAAGAKLGGKLAGRIQGAEREAALREGSEDLLSRDVDLDEAQIIDAISSLKSGKELTPEQAGALKFNREKLQAFKDLGMSDEEIPYAAVMDDPRSAAIVSNFEKQTGSDLEKRALAAGNMLKEKAAEKLDDAGALDDRGVLNEQIESRVKETHQARKAEEDALFNTIRDSVPKGTLAKSDNTIAVMKEYLDDAGQFADPSVRKDYERMIAEPPKYTELDHFRKTLNKAYNPTVDPSYDERIRGKLRDAIKEDQRATLRDIDPALEETFDNALGTSSKRFTEQDKKALFENKAGEAKRSLTAKTRTQLTNLKDSSRGFDEFITQVPKEDRKALVASSLKSMVKSNNGDVDISKLRGYFNGLPASSILKLKKHMGADAVDGLVTVSKAADHMISAAALTAKNGHSAISIDKFNDIFNESNFSKAVGGIASMSIDAAVNYAGGPIAAANGAAGSATGVTVGRGAVNSVKRVFGKVRDINVVKAVLNSPDMSRMLAGAAMGDKTMIKLSEKRLMKTQAYKDFVNTLPQKATRAIAARGFAEWATSKAKEITEGKTENER
ncbi:hypothetical protein [Photobacterium angustum]|uniref:hypothetical protein n=1 Tax=Photobacterium angustum TaxID=661 RepID=UPI0005DF9E87|nr:hypothetical protein [Photobacterium angustum]KJG00121.1 hypothetical protein UB35_19930 [Photobacterium angustum]PSV61682.1 hypothetical protein CTM95_20485 [Photobacterium angustum]